MRHFRILAVLALFLVTGCEMEYPAYHRIHRGMTAAEVRVALGDPILERDEIINDYGQHIRVWDYDLPRHENDAARERHWMYFNNGQLHEWHKGGDWDHERQNIRGRRFD